MNKHKSKIFIVDDDEEVRQSLSLLLKSAGYQTETFPGSEQFLKTEIHNGAGCILLDVFLEGKTGIELQARMKLNLNACPSSL